MNDLFEKYSVQNSELRDEMQDMWKENFDVLTKQTEEFMKAFKNGQEKNVETVVETMKTCSKGVEEFNKKMAKMAKDKSKK